MEKPLKPKKPSKNDYPPQEFIKVDKWVAKNDEDEIILIDTNNYSFIDRKYGCPKFNELEEANLEIVNNEEYKYSFIQKLYDILKQDFSFGNSLDRDGYVQGLIITIECENKEYNKQLERFNNRFAFYDRQLEKYEDKLKEYENWRKEQKIQKLKKELERAQKHE